MISDLLQNVRLLVMPLILIGISWGSGSCCLGQEQRVSSSGIASPRPTGWIVDNSGTVSTEAVKFVNIVCDEINDRLKREMCVVVIPTTNGVSQQAFATQLFNEWTVGSAGIPGAPNVWRNNGILLLIATDDRETWIELGDGIDTPGNIRMAEQIVDDTILPRFREGDGDSGIYEGIRACATRIFSVADLDAPSRLPSVSGIEYVPGARQRQRGPVTWIPWLCGGGLVGGVGLLIGGRYYMRYRPRYCETCDDELVRLEEDQDDEYLNDSEKTEEHLGSVDYDIWACLRCESVNKIRYGRLFTRYSKCPKCWYLTVLKVEKTIVQANYSRGGNVRVTEDCKSCRYHRVHHYRTPKLTKSSSSSNRSFGGGGGGSSSGFSGGSSSGGGAGGGW